MPRSLLLALETSGWTASVALLANGEFIAQRQTPADERVAQSLLPLIHQLLRAVHATPRELSAIAVACGPGSFTGLRIGVTAAKTLTFATGAKLVAVNTLDALAVQASEATGEPIWAALDAQRGDVFASVYERSDLEQLGLSDPTQLLSADQWLELLMPGSLVVGPVAARYRDRLPPGVMVAPESLCQPMAKSVGFLGSDMLARGLTCDPFQLVPRYHRQSAAEEKAAAAKLT
jgi:tRNA threonylcarbamoyladenosine biosynthesis protein TsaB